MAGIASCSPTRSASESLKSKPARSFQACEPATGGILPAASWGPDDGFLAEIQSDDAAGSHGVTFVSQDLAGETVLITDRDRVVAELREIGGDEDGLEAFEHASLLAGVGRSRRLNLA